MAKRAARVGENNFVQHACPMTDFVNLIAGKWQRGLVSRCVYPEIPPRVEYQITALGLSMRSALQPLAEWMSQHGHLLKR